MIVIVMGVSGCGKSSVGRAIAAALDWPFIEGDDLHPEVNRAKMASGTPLDDDDRWPWLDRISAAANEIERDGGSVVVACSALKRAYRDRLSAQGGDVRFVHLAGDRALIEARMQARRDHFMPPGLLDSQIATLEVPSGEEPAVELDIALPVDAIAGQAVLWLNE